MQMEHKRKECQEIGAIEEVKSENARIDFVPINEKNEKQYVRLQLATSTTNSVVRQQLQGP